MLFDSRRGRAMRYDNLNFHSQDLTHLSLDKIAAIS